MALEYKSKTKSYSCLAKSDEKDRIEVEVGDSKQKEFYPQVKVMRWDNECNVSIRLKDDGLSAESESKVSDKVVWTKGQKEVEFYELPVSEELPEGGFEFNIILKEKPDTNVIEFTLQDKDVEYFYQPELTQEEIDAGYFRPENVIGSYAIYAKEERVNYTGGKEYKCGKIGHIYRPKINDANDNWTWGELNIDKNNEKLSVTIPQDFLDKATYPVKHAAGLTYGYTSVGGSAVTGSKNDQIWGTLTTSPADISGAIIDSGSYYLKTASGTANIKATLTLYSDLSIIANGVGNAQSYSTTAAWVTSAFSTPPSLSNSTDYVIAPVYDNSALTISIYTDTVSGYYGKRDGSNSYTTPQNWGSAISYANSRYSMYVTYTASGGGVTVPTNVINMVIASD